MAYASRSGRARTSPSSPSAHAICDRCGFRYNFSDLHWQFDWRGASLMNIRILVCDRCNDLPAEQLRSIVVPADPTPIINARVEYFLADETDYQAVSYPTVLDPTTGIPIPSTDVLVTEAGDNLTTQPIGVMNGLELGAVMTLNSASGTPVLYGQRLPLLSVIANGGDQVRVTCSSAVNIAPYNLATNSQIAIEGLSNSDADGFYSITLLSATAFTYQTYGSIAPASLLTPTTDAITCLVGLPLGYDQIPLTPPGTLLGDHLAPPAGTPIGLLMALTYTF